MAAKKNIPATSAKKNYLQFIVPAIIVVATLVIYNPVMNHGFLLGWDDTEYLSNKDVQNLDIPKIFADYHLGMYQPLAVVSLALNYGAAEESPGAYHATNLFLHIINILLVWLLLLRLSKKRLVAGLGAFLFALHPMNVEPVAWMSARSTLLFTAFYIGGLLAYIRYTENGKPLHLAYTILLALLALFTKSLAMSFPLVLLVIDYYYNKPWSTRLLLEKLPFFALSIIFGFITINAANTYGHLTDIQFEYSLIDRFFILCHTYVFYLVKFVLPIELSAIYAFPELLNGRLPVLYYISAIIPLGMAYLIYRFWNSQRQIVAGILFFSFSIAPVLPIFWSRIFVAADRYAYLSFIGLYLILSVLVIRLAGSDKIRNSVIQYGTVGIMVIYGLFLMYTSSSQCKYWIDSDVLMARAVILSKTGPAKALSHFYHGNVKQGIAENKYTQGQATSNENMVRNSFIYYREAIADYDSVLVYNPDHMLTYSNRGMIYGTLQSYDEKYWDLAREDFDKAISLNPDYADNYYNKAWLLLLKGEAEAACELWYLAKEKGSVVADQAIEQNCQ